MPVGNTGLYQIYGGRLASELEFPELRIAEPGPPDWTLRVADECPPLVGSVALGEEQLTPTIRVRLSRGADRFRLVFDDTGTFDVSLDGTQITWTPVSGADHELSRIDVIGRVLALAVHAGGDVCLHASAVSVDHSAIGFLAPKGYGKSTLALSLLGSGAQLLTDDTLRVRLGERPIAVPGVYSVRLRRDSAEHLRRVGSLETDGEKYVVDGLPENELFPGETRLAALYLLAPVTAVTDGLPVKRHALAPTEATLGLMQQAKISLLLGGREGGVLMTRAAALAMRIPVYRLEIARDLHRLGEVADELHRWHCSNAEHSAAATVQ